MEALILCWSFDKRWFCGLKNPLMEFILLVPIALNLLTVAGMLLQRYQVRIEVEQYFIALVALYSLLALLSLFLLLRSYLLAEQQLKEVCENYEAIREFTHHFESKKNIWSVAGIGMVLLIIGQICCNQLYLGRHRGTYRCLTNQVRWWTDVGCWSYIALVILLFLLCKLIFLFISWKKPDTYLEYKEVI